MRTHNDNDNDNNDNDNDDNDNDKPTQDADTIMPSWRTGLHSDWRRAARTCMRVVCVCTYIYIYTHT